MSAEPLRTNKATFVATVSGLVTAASATDIFIIQGADGRKVEIDRLEISAVGTTIAVPVSLIRRSSAPSGGTSASITPVAYDSRVALVAGAAVTSWTANPTVGNAVGTLWTGRVRASATGGNPAPIFVVDCSQLSVSPICLNSASEWLAVSFGGTTVTGPLIDIYVRWTERSFLADGISG